MRAWNFNLFTWKVPKKYRNLYCPDVTESGQGVLCSAPKKNKSRMPNVIASPKETDVTAETQDKSLNCLLKFDLSQKKHELIVPFSEDVASCTHCLEPPVEPQ